MRPAGRRAVELWTAAAVAIFGGVIALESLTHDIGWNETGPGSGYFPFRIGLLLAGAALAIALQARNARSPALFAAGDELRRSASVFVPTAALVVGIVLLGCYVPSAIYLAYMLRTHGGLGWGRAASAGAAVMAAFFVVFDLWFRVPLAKGPLEAALGIY